MLSSSGHLIHVESYQSHRRTHSHGERLGLAGWGSQFFPLQSQPKLLHTIMETLQVDRSQHTGTQKQILVDVAMEHCPITKELHF